eukprot:Gb_32962 [translate_table: standard]
MDFVIRSSWRWKINGNHTLFNSFAWTFTSTVILKPRPLPLVPAGIHIYVQIVRVIKCFQIQVWNQNTLFCITHQSFRRSFGTSTIPYKEAHRKNENVVLQSSRGNSNSFRKSGDVVSSNAMITRYSKNGRIEDARHVFDKMPQRDVVSWTAMIAGYAQNRRIDEAQILFNKMPERDVISWNAMIAGYVYNGRLDDARLLFQKMPERNAGSWTSMIAGYFQNGRMEEACELFEKMPERNVASWTAMVAGFVQNGKIENARQVFDKMPQRNVVSWTAMIAGYAQDGQFEAMELFSQMQRSGVKPNQSTFSSVLNSCARLTAPEQGKQIHTYIIKIGFESDVFVGNALTNMYSKYSINDAQKMFSRMPTRDLVSWNAMIAAYGLSGRVENARQLFDRLIGSDVISWTTMIAGYAQNGYGEEAFKLFMKMQMIDMKPNQSTLTSVLSACSSLVALEQGKQVHAYIIKTQFKLNIFVGNALTTMYAKCGSIDNAVQVFDQMPERDVISWTAIISGYAQHGCAMEAIQLFEQMQLIGIKPNNITFIGVLTACSHAGLVDEGMRHFESMTRDHCITPTVDHYTCIVDLLGRSGHLAKAEDFINKIPFKPDAVVWKALLAACRVHGDIKLGKRVAEHLFELEPENPAPYVVLSNIYAACCRWDDAARVRKMMKDSGVKKEPGCSWIEVKNRVHAFVVGDRSHPQTDEIYATLYKLSGQIKKLGYVPDTRLLLHDGEEEQK